MQEWGTEREEGFGPVVRGIRALQEQLLSGAEREQVSSCLWELRRGLQAHYERERRGWLHRHGPDACPELGDDLARLERERASLLSSVDGLYARAAGRGPQPCSEEATRLASTIRRHEQDELRLLVRALYEDVGGSG